jgi:uncharacterized protein YndB with AHSA1/START domain
MNMPPEPNPSTDLAARQIVVSRTVAAPAASVFRAFVEPEHVVHWWGPFGFRNTSHAMEVKPGGLWRLTMHGPDGTDYPNLSRFVDVVPGKRLAFSHGSGRAGEPEFHVDISFVEANGRTLVTLSQTHPSAAQAQEIGKYAIEGGHQTLARLAAYVAAMRESVPANVLEGVSADTQADFVLTRELAAPRELVFRALTEPEHLDKWFGPPGMRNHVVSSDLRPGGQLRYGMKAPAGESFGRAVYREIDPPRRLAHVVSFTDERFEPVRHPASKTWPLEVLGIAALDELGGKTVLFSRSIPVHASDADVATFRAGHASMAAGWKGAYDLLDQYLATVR